MNLDPAESELQQRSDELIEALIDYCRLSHESVARIRETMDAMHMGFGDAAIHIGLITPNEVDATINWVSRAQARPQSGLIETALQRRATGRALTIRHAGSVTPGPRLILVNDPDNPRCERLRALRTELMLQNDERILGNALALLSPCPAEGRSQLAAELAIAFSQLGRTTLLVDGDLRHPRQHELFGADNQWGLAQALAFGEAPRMLAVEGLPSLSLLIAGPSPSNPLELLSAARFDQLMAEWRRTYDFVIIDTPAVTRYSDALAIATLAGRVLTVSRAQMTPYRDMKDMMRRIASTKSRVVGAVINHFE